MRVDVLKDATSQAAIEVGIKYRFCPLDDCTSEDSGWRERLPLPISDSNARIVVDPYLKSAVDYYNNRPAKVSFVPRPWKQWRIGWSAGIGVIRNEMGTDLGPALVFGVQF